jgi:hypothetical protein
MRRRVLSFVAFVGLVSWAGGAAAQNVGIDASQDVGTAMAFSVEPTAHFVNTMEAGPAETTLVGNGFGVGATARGMLFPLARPGGALGFGLQASAGYAQLFNAGNGLLIGTGGLRYVYGNPRTAYWADVNGGYGLATDPGMGAAPYVDVGIGWQFAASPSFMWGVAGRWSFFFPDESYGPAAGGASRNYSFISLALVLEWGPPRWQEVAITPIPMAQATMPPQQQGAVPVYQQPGQPVQVYPQAQTVQPQAIQPQPIQVQPQQGSSPGAVTQTPISNPGPASYSNTPNDQDRDGIGDAADQCVSYAEDMNGREDNDGCPDADRDTDGVPDVLDQCPARAEDFDGTRDEDGCPD